MLMLQERSEEKNKNVQSLHVVDLERYEQETYGNNRTQYPENRSSKRMRRRRRLQVKPKPMPMVVGGESLLSVKLRGKSVSR